MNENFELQYEQLLKAIRAMTKREDITEDFTLMEMGIDSLNVIELILICQSIYKDASQPELLKFDEYTTLKELHHQLVSLSQVTF